MRARIQKNSEGDQVLIWRGLCWLVLQLVSDRDESIAEIHDHDQHERISYEGKQCQNQEIGLVWRPYRVFPFVLRIQYLKICQKEGDQQCVYQVYEEGADQRYDDEGQVGGAVALGHRGHVGHGRGRGAQ